MEKVLYGVLLVSCLLFSACSDDRADEVLLSSAHGQNDFDTRMQLSESDRDAKAEKVFLDKFKAAAKTADLLAFKKLYNLDNANPEYIAMIDYIFNKRWAKNYDDISFSIEPNNKAKKYSTYFTIPYLGDIVIKSISGQGTGTTKIPVGIKDGVYHLTIGRK